MKATLKVTNDGIRSTEVDQDDGRSSPPYGVVQPPDLPQRRDLDVNQNTKRLNKNATNSGLLCCTATKAVRRTYSIYN